MIGISLCILLPVLYLVYLTDRFDPIADIRRWSDWIKFLLLFLVCFLAPIIYILMGIKGIVSGLSTYHTKRKWISSATCAQVSIIDRHAERNDYAEYREEEWYCDLAIRMPSIIENVTGEQIVWAGVNQRVYQRYKNKDVARIYYDPTNPLAFMIEGE
jgi:hypothetical protein